MGKILSVWLMPVAEHHESATTAGPASRAQPSRQLSRIPQQPAVRQKAGQLPQELPESGTVRPLLLFRDHQRILQSASSASAGGSSASEGGSSTSHVP